MKHFEWTMKRWKTAGMLAAMLLMVAPMICPQASVAQVAGTATLKGHVQNAAGFPLTKGEVRLTTDRSADTKGRKYAYTFPLDAKGDYSGTGIVPGDYLAIVYQGDISVDFIDSVKIAAGEAKTADFDMTRKEYLDKMTPEEKKALEDFKKANAAAMAANSKIANLNAALIQSRADTKAGNFAAAITAMKEATATKPDEAILWLALADAQLGDADASAKAAKANGKSSSDPEVVQKYSDAAASYQKGIELNAASKKPNPDTAGTAYNQLGQAYGKMGDATKSSAAYEEAVKAQPAQAGMYYYNESATLYNAGKMDESASAADKAITADPKRADAYYIKAQALIPKASVDPKTQKIVAPPGCVEAYQKYLELAPTGPHAEEVKQILAGIGEEVKSGYKAPPTPKKK